MLRRLLARASRSSQEPSNADGSVGGWGADCPNPLVFNNTRYQSNLVETVVPAYNQGRFAGLTGTLTTTGISTATATPFTFTDSFKTNGTLILP